MRSQLLTLTLLALVAGTPAWAGEHGHGDTAGKGHGRAWCPHCGEACYPTVTKGKETKHCFDTESKTICIPKVRFPWEGPGLNLSFGRSHGKGKGKGNCFDCGGKDGCLATKCGRTRDVNVLIKHEYECTVCKYSWDPAGFKGGAKNDGKYFDAPQPAEGEPATGEPATGEPATGEPAVPQPPPVEARRLPSRNYVRPVSRESSQSDEAAPQPPARRGGLKFFSKYFK